MALVVNDTIAQSHQIELTPDAVVFLVPSETPTLLPTDTAIPPSTDVPIPIDTPVPTLTTFSNETPMPVATDTVFPAQIADFPSISTGIGITRIEWEIEHGPGEKVDIFNKYDNDNALDIPSSSSMIEQLIFDMKLQSH